MKTYAAILMLMSACAIPVEPTTQEQVGSTDPALSGQPAPIKYGLDICVYGSPRLVIIDGVTYVQQVPVPCSYGWVDPSDPGPERAKKDLIDPAPEHVELNTSR